ncbi:hypothetical protein LEP1GSC170_3462 [Leptospira interrogans serovar Bataviae str. HAI135]|nr:hypothetical protein LEP1GSC170_3462 [Leptospira interrogans serovar Bataviae str. HAI135]
MISLEEIRKKCLLYYHKVLNRAVLGEKSFPWEISTGKIDPEEIIHNPSLLEKIKRNLRKKRIWVSARFFSKRNEKIWNANSTFENSIRRRN